MLPGMGTTGNFKYCWEYKLLQPWRNYFVEFIKAKHAIV